MKEKKTLQANTKEKQLGAAALLLQITIKRIVLFMMKIILHLSNFMSQTVQSVSCTLL